MKSFRPFLAAAFAFSIFTHGYAADSRADFLKLIDRPQVPLALDVQELSSTNGLAAFHFTFAADAKQRVPGMLWKQPGHAQRQPVIILLHGTGGTKNDMLPLARKLVEKGFISVAIDGRYHGERASAGKGAAEYNEAIARAWDNPVEHPFYYDTVWDVMRLIDYLETREDVDPKRIGLMGISKGGIETYLTAAVDPRIAVAIPCIGVQSFEWALEHNEWQGRIGTIQKGFNAAAKQAGVSNPDTAFVRKFYDRLVPGIYTEFDGPLILPLITPRPLLVINSDSDDHTPLAGLQECITAARKAYQNAGAEDHFAVRIQEKTGHKVLPESEHAAVDWFIQWLKP